MKINWSDPAGYAGTMVLTTEPLKIPNNAEKSMNLIISGFGAFSDSVVIFAWVWYAMEKMLVSRRDAKSQIN